MSRLKPLWGARPGGSQNEVLLKISKKFKGTPPPSLHHPHPAMLMNGVPPPQKKKTHNIFDGFI
jgi:hypothetical protein